MKIVYKRDDCIGCGTCSFVCPDYWEITDDAKSSLKGARKNGQGDFELEIKNADENTIKCFKESAESCPVQIIKIEE